jgi:hypothetical protein
MKALHIFSSTFVQMNVNNSKNINAVDPIMFEKLTTGFNAGFIDMNMTKLIKVEAAEKEAMKEKRGKRVWEFWK